MKRGVVIGIAAAAVVVVAGAAWFALSAASGGDATPSASPTPSASTAADDVQAVAQAALDAYVDECTQSAAAVPADCGLRVPWAADLATLERIDYRIEEYPAIVLSPDDPTFAAPGGVVVATATGTTSDGETARFTYRDDDWTLRGFVARDGDELVLSVG